MARDHKRLGDLLIDENILTPENLADAITEQRRSGELLGSTLVRMGLVTEHQLMKVLQLQLGLPLVDLAEVVADEQALSLIKEDLARKYSALPLELEGRKTLVVAMGDPLNVAALEDLRFHSGMFIKPVLALPSAIQEAIARYYHIDTSMNEVISNIISTEEELVISAITEEDPQAQAIDELMKEAEGKPIVRLTNWLLHRAVEDRASDIHIEPQEKEIIVRLRVDGLLQAVQRLPKWTQSAIVSRIKVLSNLDIAEKRQPQDGRLMADVRGRRVDMRVSTLPTTHGEKVVIRVVDQLRANVSLDEVGLLPDDLAHIRRFLDRPQGIILVTGPTGSGKSTLLYAALRHLQHETRNIVTVEDPVEYQIGGISQVQVDEKAKKTFPAALRAILRQDPDVIMIGEIRDRETAQIAFRASVTGHLVLSTVHTNDAAGAVTRLVDLGLEPFMVASSLLGVVSMRLVRTLCPRCKETYEVNASNLNRLGVRDLVDGTVELSRGRGCPNCRETGYIGRTGVFEVLEISDHVRGLVLQNSPDSAIRQAAVESGMRGMGEDGLKKVMMGRTTLEEVTRVVYLAENEAKTCVACDAVVARTHEFCTQCGAFVGDHCTKCHRRIDTKWTFCPHCGNDSGRAREDDAEGSKPDISHGRRPRRGRAELRKAG
ncbi:MAG: Flp pilus assembly complex ATPase component TadA [Candidatus Eisenbacteria bacterium]|uniref:Flp pilus assembly complex ATPase component TadA n=1 Tax=Eiseniibacteriota bacterium TaxID=2212470 RepID=A0A849SPV6_UNCEI|nr:Flp pilus assembly complex ATPase component TadA [Candidatus Eisenbacteria bacterium]